MQSAQRKQKISRYLNEDELYWKKHQSGFSLSGLTRTAYCQAKGVDYDRFTYWLTKLAQSACEKAMDEQQEPPQVSVPLLPVHVKSQARENNLLCSLTLKNGLTLQIHDPVALSIILERGM